MPLVLHTLPLEPIQSLLLLHPRPGSCGRCLLKQPLEVLPSLSCITRRALEVIRLFPLLLRAIRAYPLESTRTRRILQGRVGMRRVLPFVFSPSILPPLGLRCILQLHFMPTPSSLELAHVLLVSNVGGIAWLLPALTAWAYLHLHCSARAAIIPQVPMLAHELTTLRFTCSLLLLVRVLDRCNQ